MDMGFPESVKLLEAVNGGDCPSGIALVALMAGIVSLLPGCKAAAPVVLRKPLQQYKEADNRVKHPTQLTSISTILVQQDRLPQLAAGGQCIYSSALWVPVSCSLE